MIAATQTQLVPGGQSAISTVIAPPDLASDLTWRLISDADGTIAIAESSSGIVEVDDGQDPGLRRYTRTFTAPATGGRYIAIWRLTQLEEVAHFVVVAISPDARFASPEDVGRRLARVLTGDEETNVMFLLNMAAVVIADAAGYDDGWAATLTPVPNMLRMMSVELVCRTISNPKGYSQIRQQAGSYSFQASLDTVGMVLTDPEVMMIRRAIHGRTTDSVRVESSFDRAQDAYWLRKQTALTGGTDDRSPGVIA